MMGLIGQAVLVLSIVGLIDGLQVPTITNYTVINGNSLKESIPVGTVLGSVTAFDPDGTNVEYYISGNGGENFVLDKNTGVVTLSARLDFEVKEQITSRLRVQDQNQQVTVKDCVLVVLDENDELPVFTYETIEEKLLESTDLQTKVHDVEVTDRDTRGDTITLTCDDTTESKRDACETFELRLSQDSNKYWRGALYLKKELDYETRKSYIYSVEAFDGLNSQINDIHIEVLDVNDSPPKWQKTNPVLIKEELPIGDPITTVKAVDGDESGSREIYYELIRDHTDVFNINSTTGVISIAQRLDFDSPSSRKDKPFTLIVKAREMIPNADGTVTLGDDAFTTATIDIKVTMEDINDNGPEFVENGQNKTSYTVFIDEDIINGQNIPGLLMTVTDRDQTEIFNSFALETDAYRDTFRVIPTEDSSSTSPTIYVFNSNLIDYEAGPRQYVIEVTARENKVLPAHTGTATVTIHVRDVNDQTPVFSEIRYSEVIYEDHQELSRQPVVKIEATDSEDLLFGTNGIRYKLYGNIPEHFYIDELTGQLSTVPCTGTPGVKPCIDFEEKREYTLNVQATDNGGVDGRSRSVEVKITLLDRNDNTPTMDDSISRYIYEEQTVTVNPLIIEAEDPDTVGGPVTYTLKGDTSGLWKITPGFRDANITAKRAILYTDAPDQNLGEFNFLVEAADQKQSSVTRVNIKVIDINNNAPYFLSNVYTADLPEITTDETSLVTVYARDLDDASTGNGIIDFAIQSGSAGKFSMKNRQTDPFSIDIFTIQDATFDFDKQRQFNLTLECRDRGTPQSKTGTTSVLINIRDRNNVSPIIRPTSTTINVREDTPLDFSVHQINADDPDVNKILRYVMTPDSAIQPTGAPAQIEFRNMFRVESNTGIVRVNSQLNRDQVAFITNNLTVTDDGASGPPQVGTGALFIRITEINDQDPVFTIQPYNVSLQEEKTTTSYVRTLECTDADDRIASYSISQVTPRFPQYFDLLPATGAIVINNRIDYEQIEYIELTATCFDTGQPSRSATTQFYVYVENINDLTPIFDEESYRGQLYEGVVTSEMYLLTVSASDGDKGDFGVVKFKLSNADPFFRIEEDSGDIYVLPGATFDRERSERYDLQVTVYDSPLQASGRRESTVPVYITILDINDNCPVFTLPLYSRVVPESFERDITVLDIGASDEDTGDNGELIFAIVPGSADPAGSENLFVMDSRSDYGRLLTKTALKDHVGVITFNVSATDGLGGAGACTTVVPVRVEITESQNDAPEWIRPPNRDSVIEVLESQYRGMLVYNSKAIDHNEGPSGVIDYHFLVNNNEVANTSEFRINRITGVIRADVVFDREQVSRYFLTLMARDQGIPSASSETTLTVVIKDVDDNDPKFPIKDGSVQPLVLHMPSGVPDQSQDILLGNCSYLATDDDSDHENNRIYYRLITTNANIQDHILVVKDTCKIYLKAGSTYDERTVLEFDILGYNEKNDDTVIRYKREVNPSILPVRVEIPDSLDNSPEFAEEHYLACASIDTPYRETILQVQASDPDGEPVTYSIGSGSQTQTFGIHQTLGTLYNTISFRYGAQSRRLYTVEVQASDVAGNAATSKATIFITAIGNLVRLKISRSRTDVDPFKQLFVSTIKANSNGKIDFACVDSVTNHRKDDGEEDTNASDMYLMAAQEDNGQYDIIPASELSAMIDGMMDEDNNLLSDIFVTSVEAKDDGDDWDLDEDAVLAIFIICILLILLAIILVILACYCIRKSKNKKVKKLKAERHTVVQVQHQPVATSVNPVYAMGPDNDDYSTVQKSSRMPITPMVIPAPQDLQPVPSPAPTDLQPAQEPEEPEEPEPFIETEVLPDPVPQAQEPVQSPAGLAYPEYEDRIETTVVEDAPPRPATPEEEVAFQEPEPAQVAESLPDEDLARIPTPVPDEGEIDVEIKDTPPDTPPSTPSTNRRDDDKD